MTARCPIMLMALSLLMAGCGLTGGDYPSLLPRPEEAPRLITLPETGPAMLSAEEGAQLQADLARAQAELEAALQALRGADRELDQALARARGSPWGSLAWTDAQVALSRFQEARFPLSAVLLRLDDSRMMVDPLASDDQQRVAVLALHLEVEMAEQQASARAAAASRLLER